MLTITRIRTTVGLGAALAFAVASTLAGFASSPKFFDDDPLQRELESQDASRMVPTDLRLFTDIAYNMIRGAAVDEGTRAQNLNTVDEVPDSGWFTNRAGVLPLTASDVATGPDTNLGPRPGRWTVIASKSDGVTPGFTIRDADGERWFLKFDPRGYRGMMTGTEVSVSKLMWALGYHVPENHIAFMRRDQLTVDEGATLLAPGGLRRRMRTTDIDALLSVVNKENDGSYRVVASRALPGRPIGRIRFFGTRSDDPNDLVAHEHRRELRGYGVFAAWLNHVDAKGSNSLDTLVAVNGRSVVRHNLIDFGSALGSGGLGPADYWEGEEYLLEPAQTAKQMAGFGFVRPRWRTEAFHESPAIGRFPRDNSQFDPSAWKPRVPNRAFLSARADDRFWAARKVAAMRTELIRAAITKGQFDSPADEEFLVRALAERRDAIARAYLVPVNPISDPALQAGTVTFVNAAVDMDVAPAPKGYRAVWSSFDNATGTSTRLAETTGRTTRLAVPDTLARVEGAYVHVELSAIEGADPSWEVPVHAYFRLRGGEWRLVGFERMTGR